MEHVNNVELTNRSKGSANAKEHDLPYKDENGTGHSREARGITGIQALDVSPESEPSVSPFVR
jgi:hypothetical protein